MKTIGNILEALSSDAFGVGIERSEEAQKLLGKLAELNLKHQFSGTLSDEEKSEQTRLQSIFGLSPNIKSEGSEND